MISDEARLRVKRDSVCMGGKLTHWSSLGRFPKRPRKHQRIGPLALGISIVATPPAGPGEARRFVKRDGRGIVRRNLKKSPFGPPQPRLIQEPRDKLASKTPSPGIRSDRKGQKLGLACNGPTQKEARVALDQQESQRVRQKARKIGRTPGWRRAERAGMQARQRFGRHGRITGGGSEGGAASAPRR